MAKKKEVSVEQKLRALYDLQLIDSRIDEIRNVRGELPLEVEDLQDEVTGLNTRLSNLSEDVTNLETDINNKKIAIEESNTLMKKYEEQQKNVRNNREFDSLAKETEKEEKILLDKSKEFSESIDAHLLNAYTRIRNKVKNGLAVVSIERGASGGSFFTIPPQIQLEIANRKKITIDEHSGRILIDAGLAAEEKEKIDSLFS